MTDSIATIALDEKSLIRSDQFKGRRDRAITDLLEENSFAIEGERGPFDMSISIVENRILLRVTNDVRKSQDISLSLAPLRRVIKDYAIICESYFEAVKTANPRKIEAIDMGRRGVHNEGAEIVEELLGGQARVDFDTARKFFALIYVLQST